MFRVKGLKMQYTIHNDTLSCKVDSLGGELVSVVKGGKERVWQNQTGEWAGHGPLLFPVCGHCGVKVDGVEYPISAHGFAKKMQFSLVKKTETEVVLAIEANEETKKVYPFDFRFEVSYALKENVLFIGYRVINPAEKPLYFACGGHESFALDCGVENYEIAFEKQENLVHYFHDNDGYMTGERKAYGTLQTLPLPKDFLQEGRTLIFKDVLSRKVWLCERGGKKLATITFDGFENLLVWHAGKAPFICIEPWTNLPDPAGEADVEFKDKGGVIEVSGNAEKTLVRTIAYE